jgi:hypothetical protein
MSQTSIPSSSLVFKTRQYYIENTDPNTAKGEVLTFEDLDKSLLFLSKSISSTTGSGIYSSSYSGSDVSTAYTVGGIGPGIDVDQLEGKNISTLFDEIFFPTILPTAQPAGTATTSLTLSDGSGTTRETGATVDVTLTTTFTKGKWKAGTLVNTEREYYGDAVLYRFISSSTTINNGTNNSYTFSNHKVANGSNTFSTLVSHSAGQQPIDSKGNNSGTTNPAGTLSPSNSSFTGIYPYFYGSSSADVFTVNDVTASIQDLYNGGTSTATKVVASSADTITGFFYNTSPMWCWFAHPSTSTAKIKWYQFDQNSGDISPTSTFNQLGTKSVTATGYWNGVSYRIYITVSPTQFDQSQLNQYKIELRKT